MYAASPQYLDKAHRLIGRPVFLGEFHFGMPGRGLAPVLVQMRLGERGHNLGQGQRQLIAITHAVLADCAS